MDTATLSADFDKAVPILAAVNALAETYAGDIYRKIAGTIENVQTWTADHAAIIAAAEGIAATLPYAAIVIPGLNLGLHVLGALGQLMAADPTVKGPSPAPSIPSTVAA